MGRLFPPELKVGWIILIAPVLAILLNLEPAFRLGYELGIPTVYPGDRDLDDMVLRPNTSRRALANYGFASTIFLTYLMLVVPKFGLIGVACYIALFTLDAMFPDAKFFREFRDPWVRIIVGVVGSLLVVFLVTRSRRAAKK